MERFFFEISYNGTEYFGWQRQPKQISVQEEIETCLIKLYSNKKIEIVGCGRTDTGVHAKQYFFHVDLELDAGTEDQMRYKLNKMLSANISVQRIFKLEKHARFDATLRTYRYFIHSKKDPFRYTQSWYLNQVLDVEKMNSAANLLIGKKDFTSFAKLHTDVKTNICTVSKAEWKISNEGELYFEISADRFLRNMVRAIVGTLVDVGLGKIESEAIAEILENKDRGEASTSAPACGLFLWEIRYE
ncbi:MAG: tRNA pseudouridine(38-40) synthase TruA [Bacteroidetes bacterium]|nr:MAG: tRNA pseudouridine(38-40) synthase TruA [Bacteroidota bacterium]